MPNFNSINLVGHTGKDAVLRAVGDSQVANFTMAYTRKRKDKETTTWFDVSVWGKPAAFIAEHVKKGDPVMVSGELYQETYGEGKVALRIDAQNVTLLRGKQTAETSAPTKAAANLGSDPF